MQGLNHKNITKVKDSFEDERFIYLVMNYRFNDFRNLFNDMDAALVEDFAKKVFYDMLKAVNHCHKHGIVHKDIKMENFLVDIESEEESMLLELTDFGVACQVSDKVTMKERAGTLVCMAPEMIDPNAKKSPKVDCWSLGIVLFELLTGYLPFYHEDKNKLEFLISRAKIDYEKIRNEYNLSK